MTERFEKINLPLKDALVLRRKLVSDSRGYLERLYCEKEFSSFGWNDGIKQINRTFTKEKGSIRGMHFQNPKGEMKLISCLKGKIWDVIIDLRSDSPTFLNWHAEVISENENDSLLIPKGFAHGFQTLENNCELVYLHSEFYYPEFEQGLRYDDPQLDISWPLEVTFCSNRDLNHKLLSEYEFSGI